ncbi:AT-rich interactive domain-containing protein 3C-like [Amphibalanus amphitrite]|uniref:AT-rich interactive domain-containing protein 3C-like n=1 Tax=Amphibalanus amphitrite TaxID=1232801 RepID=UPI001C8FACD6|nr:AT-rich interactive domain-containing protein 3C-like [Amphibalanus amphitrite]
MHGSPLLISHAADMDGGKEAGVETAVSGGLNSAVWGAAAHYRQLLQHQHQQLQQHTEDDGNMSDGGSAGSREHSPAPRSDPEPEAETNDDSCSQDVLEKLKQQVANVAHVRSRKDTNDNEAPDFRLREPVQSRASADPSSLPRHRLSPQSLLAASMASNPPSLVPLPGLGGLASYGGAAGRASSASPPAREAASPPTSSSGHSPRQPAAATGTGNTQAPWNYEEQFKQLYEIDDNPKRKEFLDELFRFMQNRGTPINRLPIMAKQVLDLYELYNLVVARGGLVEVINKKLWQEIIKGLKLPSSITSAAFTLRTQYMKYLYPQECQKEGLSSPSELQAAVDGNRREGRRSSYTNNSYADFVQRSPLLSGQMAPSFGLGNGMPMPTSLHQQGLSPLSLVTSRPAAPGSNGPAGHPMPPSSPFLPAMGGPVMPSANDTLMTLWSLYNRQQQQQQPPSPPGRRPEPPPPAAPQSEALNLGVRREMARQEREREQQEREREQLERDRSRELELHRERELELEREREREMKREMPEDMSPPNKRAKSEEGDNKMESMPHTKMSISSKADGSLVLSMELNGVVYQGILFAQPSPGR